jgi:hypothetical protein
MRPGAEEIDSELLHLVPDRTPTLGTAGVPWQPVFELISFQGSLVDFCSFCPNLGLTAQLAQPFECH